MASAHIKLSKYKKHEDQKGCVNKHEPKFENPKFPACAYRLNGYNETLTGKIKDNGSSKKSLYELNFSNKSHRARLPGGSEKMEKMESFKPIGRPPKAIKKPKKYLNRDPRDPKYQGKAWHFIGDNYKVSHLPFGHEYHHIMPEEAISSELTFTEARILQEADYNINNGKNMIILPITMDVAYALMLPRHKGRHRSYNNECMIQINNFKKKVNKSSTTHTVSKDNVGGVRDEIMTWQENEFKRLVDCGRAAAGQGAAAEINKMYKSNKK